MRDFKILLSRLKKACSNFIIWVYCWVDENITEILGDTKIRKRGFEPALSDIEVITMEIVGEFISFDTDKWIWKYFKTHWQSWFPKLSSRSSFAKQVANLWHVKHLLQARLSSRYKGNTVCHIVDGFPITTAHFKRAKKSLNFKGELAMDIARVNRKLFTVSKDTYLLIAKETSLASPLLKQQVAKERRFGN
jgi:hypothetical protein